MTSQVVKSKRNKDCDFVSVRQINCKHLQVPWSFKSLNTDLTVLLYE